MVPQTNVDCVGLRPIIRNTQAGAVISFLVEKGRSASHHDWNTPLQGKFGIAYADGACR